MEVGRSFAALLVHDYVSDCMHNIPSRRILLGRLAANELFYRKYNIANCVDFNLRDDFGSLRAHSRQLKVQNQISKLLKAFSASYILTL